MMSINLLPESRKNHPAIALINIRASMMSMRTVTAVEKI
jgi:hypothetical protein